MIGCLWNPSKSQPRNLKPFLGYSTRPVPEVSQSWFKLMVGRDGRAGYVGGPG